MHLRCLSNLSDFGNFRIDHGVCTASARTPAWGVASSRVQELRGEERSSRAWLWTSVSDDAVCFHIDASRSAEAAEKLFAEVVLYAVIVCDRYSAYKQLARMLGGLVTLAFCWGRVRREFIDCAAGQPRLEQWCQGWVGRTADIFRLNEARLEHHDPGLKRQTLAFDTAQAALEAALDILFVQAEREPVNAIETPVVTM